MALTKQYSDPKQFLEAYNPDLQPRCASHPAKCFLGTAPTLRTVGQAYGTGVSEMWLEIQLKDLARYAGSLNKLDETQSEQTARAIIAGYPQLNVAELMLFFQRFKAGKYGKFYGAVDPLTITTALREFSKQRIAEITAIELAQRNAELQKPRKGITYKEYQALKARAEAGDYEAQQRLLPPEQRDKKPNKPV